MTSGTFTFQKEFSAGTVSLAVLRNLEAAGLLESVIQPSDSGPPRRCYHATADGRRMLAHWAKAWHATRDSVDSNLKGALP